MTARRPRPPRPTRVGWALLAASAALLTAGVAADYPELATLGASGVVALAVGLFWTAVPPVLSAERRLASTRPAEGESVRCQLIVVNPGRRRSRPVEAVEPMAAGPVWLPRIPAGARHQTEPYELVFPRRGRYRLPPPFLGRSDPLGLLRGGAPTPGQPTTVQVHPQVHPVLVPGVDQVAATPALRGSAAPAGASFHSLRPYALGDDARRIHWLSSVRLCEWMVREERELPRRPRCLIVLDTGAYRYPALALFDEAVRVAASVCVWAIRSGVPTDLRAGPAGLAPSATETGVLDVLTTVATTSERPGLAALLPPVPAYPTALTLVTGRLTAGEMTAVVAATERWAAAHIVSIDPAAPAPTATASTPESRAVPGTGGVPGGGPDGIPAPGGVPGSWPVTRVRTSADFAVLWRRR